MHTSRSANALTAQLLQRPSARRSRPEAAIQIHYTQAGGITGHIMLLCMLFM